MFDTITINTDGACKGNPGPMGISFIIKFDDGKTHEYSAFAGIGTNNIAEYKAVTSALKYLKDNNIFAKNYIFKSDSQLIVNQLSNKWRVKEPDLIGLKKTAVAICKEIKSNYPEAKFEWQWIRRDQNKQADKLASSCFK